MSRVVRSRTTRHNVTVAAVLLIVRGFALSEDAAFSVLVEWNARCVPPWSERELRAKINAALRYGKEELGALAKDGSPLNARSPL